jgi:hypothetical protein
VVCVVYNRPQRSGFLEALLSSANPYATQELSHKAKLPPSEARVDMHSDIDLRRRGEQRALCVWLQMRRARLPSLVPSRSRSVNIKPLAIT